MNFRKIKTLNIQIMEKYIKRIMRYVLYELKTIIRPIILKREIQKKKLFYSSLIKNNDLVFDIGANYGNRVEPFLRLGANVIAIEPQKKCCDYLSSKYGDKIKILQVGLGEEEGVKEFYISNASTISSFSQEWIKKVSESRFKNYNWSNSISVPIITLDSVIEKYGVPKFIKIDVEGFELQVLKGLSKCIPLISFEYTVPECLPVINECINQIRKFNPNVEFNYSIGESMNMNSRNWYTYEEIIKVINSKVFISSNFGDIYVRSIL